MKFIIIQPVAEIREELLTSLGEGLKEVIGYPYRISPLSEIPESSYNKDRGQYDAEVLLGEIAKNNSSVSLLGVIDVDLYVESLNFVFGLADKGSAIISITRLRPEFYGEKRNEHMFKERVLKESIHELGHTFGLHHCPDKRCVMHFSNSLEDTDIKSTDFCRNCSIIINRKLSS
ncbi:MAG: archaemetzincin family Zn-dependent metalloprotease [Methanosarcinales archaeon]|nr:archaemetzincin family Zn-dependent metalloprotease [Methanosarcinales archaeon]